MCSEFFIYGSRKAEDVKGEDEETISSARMTKSEESAKKVDDEQRSMSAGGKKEEGREKKEDGGAKKEDEKGKKENEGKKGSEGKARNGESSPGGDGEGEGGKPQALMIKKTIVTTSTSKKSTVTVEPKVVNPSMKGVVAEVETAKPKPKHMIVMAHGVLGYGTDMNAVVKQV